MRKYRRRVSTLLAVTGAVILVVASFFGLNALFRSEYEQASFTSVFLYYLVAGIALLLLRYFLFILPDRMREHRSESMQQRRAEARGFKHPRSSTATPVPRDEGSILVMVLVLLGLVAAASLMALESARLAHQEADAGWRVGLLKLAAVDAARAAMKELADDPDLLVDHPGEAWAAYQETTDPAGITRMVRISDAQNGYDLNNLAVEPTGDQLPAREIIANIMVHGGVFTPGQRPEALRDYVDADSGGPFETSFYQAMTPPARTADRILYGLDDLFQVHGWDADLFQRKERSARRGIFDAELADSLSVLPVSRDRVIPVNINSAEPAALAGVLGMDAMELVERVVRRRKESPFTSLDVISSLLGDETFARLAPHLSVNSSYFHIQTAAYQDGKTTRLHLLAHRGQDGRVDIIRAFF